MPKGKKKGKYEHRRTEQAYSSDEDAGIDMTIDNCSETSAQSDLKSNHDEAGNRASGKKTGGETRVKRAVSLDIGSRLHRVTWKQMACKWEKRPPKPEMIEEIVLTTQHLLMINRDQRGCYIQPEQSKLTPEQIKQNKENEIQEKLEEKVLEVIESLSARAGAARASAWSSLRVALQRRALDQLLSSHRATLADHAARALRRGKDNERKAAAAAVPLLALQIGEEGTEEFVREVRPALTHTATDKTASLDTRTECCSSLAVLCYLMEDDLTEILEVMRVFETIFSGSYLKGDGSVKVCGAAVEAGACHAAALDAWALLYTLLPPHHALQLLTTQPPSFDKLAQLLHACSLEVRLAAGTALAIVHECVCEGEEDSAHPLAPHVERVLPRLAELARDSHKYRAKRDRKLQRATFRDILKYFEEGEVSSMSVRVGAETARWCSWSGGAAYSALAAALSAGLAPLALVSARLRHALALSDVPPPDLLPKNKPNKLQRHLQNTAACKARTLVRNKNRDKRSAALAL